jgi:hypothetical protein
MPPSTVVLDAMTTISVIPSTEWFTFSTSRVTVGAACRGMKDGICSTVVSSDELNFTVGKKKEWACCNGVGY